MKSSTFASDEVLSKFKATKCEVTKGSTYLLIHGWKFHSHHDTICYSKDLLHLARSIETIVNTTSALPAPNCTAESPKHELQHSEHESYHVHINGYSLHLPPMLFLNDCISIQHIPSKISITHRAADALVAWAAQHSAKVIIQHPLKIIQVPYANTWTKRSLPQLNSSSQSSSSTETVPATVFSEIPFGDEKVNEAAKTDANSTIFDKTKWDWTFTSDYCCTIDYDDETSNGYGTENTIVTTTVLADCINGSSKNSKTDTNQRIPFPFTYRTNAAALQTKEKSASTTDCESKWQWHWEQEESSGLDMALLRRGSENPTEAPILFYDEFTLYQDDLEDCGEVSFDVKVRVMPLCWFTLVRCFLRVDDGVVRMKETRLFHAFNEENTATPADDDNASTATPVKVHVVVTWKELDLSVSSTSTVSSSQQQQQQPPSSSLLKSVLRNANELSEKMPVVNQNYNIPQYYTLYLSPLPSVSSSSQST